MVCYTLEEQNDTTNKFLDVVDANDMPRELKTYLNIVVINLTI